MHCLSTHGLIPSRRMTSLGYYRFSLTAPNCSLVLKVEHCGVLTMNSYWFLSCHQIACGLNRDYCFLICSPRFLCPINFLLGGEQSNTKAGRVKATGRLENLSENNVQTWHVSHLFHVTPAGLEVSPQPFFISIVVNIQDNTFHIDTSIWQFRRCSPVNTQGSQLNVNARHPLKNIVSSIVHIPFLVLANVSEELNTAVPAIMVILMTSLLLIAWTAL